MTLEQEQLSNKCFFQVLLYGIALFLLLVVQNVVQKAFHMGLVAAIWASKGET